MQHLFCGAPLESLSHVPFDPALDGTQVTGGRRLSARTSGGFVGSDILAGIVATGLHEAASSRRSSTWARTARSWWATATGWSAPRPRRARLSKPAGFAWACARPKAPSPTSSSRDGAFRVPGARRRRPRGICGSGLVAAVAAALDLGLVMPNGRLANGARELPLAGPVSLTQADIRELQLAKGAIAAGLRMLTARFGATPADLDVLYLAGAFGNYVHVESARRIGLLDLDPRRIVPAGNTALRGTKMIALAPSRRAFYTEELPARVEHVPLASDPAFQETFVDCLAFG